MKPKIRIGKRRRGKTRYLTQWLMEKSGKRVLIVSTRQEKREVEKRLPADAKIDIIIGSATEKLRGMDIDVVGVDNLWHFDNPKQLINALLNRRAEIMCTLDDIFDIDRIYSGDLENNS